MESIPCYSHNDRFSKHLLWDVSADGCRVISEVEITIAMLFIHLFIPNILTCPLSSVGCNTWGREAEWNLFSAAIRIRPKFRVSLHRMNSLVTPVLKYPVVQRQKCGFISPLLLWWEGIINSSHTKSAARGCLCTLTVFLCRNPLQFPEPRWDFMISQSCSSTRISIFFSPFLPPSLFLILQFIWAIYLGIYYKLQGWGCAD